MLLVSLDTLGLFETELNCEPGHKCPLKAQNEICIQGRLLSDWDLHLGKKGLSPRTVSAEFLSSGKTVDFVTYVENPYKHLPKPEANRKIAALRNTRMVPSYQDNAS